MVDLSSQEMKIKHLLLILIAVLAVSCSSKPSGAADASGALPADSVAAATPEKQPQAAENSENPELLGYYVGDFKATQFKKGKNPSFSNRINISIDQIAGGKVTGHSVVAGSLRPFSGSINKDGNGFKVEAAEPGDDKYDGKFSFVLHPDNKSITGTWVANDANLAVTERSYDLVAKTFAYDANLTLPEEVAWQDLYGKVPDPDWQRSEITTSEVTRINPSKVKLKKEDVENMRKGDLEILRNSIYARHGYTFKNRKMRYVFDQHVPWYIPVSTDVSKELTQLEEENIALIKRYEEHAEAYYDEFGR
jgi:YARHG domain